MSQREFARRVGRSHVWVNRLVKEGRLPANAKRQIPLEAGLAVFQSAFSTTDIGTVIHNEAQRAAGAKKRAPKKSTAKATPKKAPSKKAEAKKKQPKIETESIEETTPKKADPSSVPDIAQAMGAAKINEQYSRARLAKETFIAKLKELEYKEAEGRLIKIEDVRRDAQRSGAEVRERLFGIPSRVAGVCEGKPAREIERIIDEAINDALSALKRSRFTGGNSVG